MVEHFRMLKKHQEKTDLSQISSKSQWSKWPGPFRQTLSHLSAKNAAAVTLKCYSHTSSQIPVLSMCSFPVSIRFYQCLRTNVTSTKQCVSLGLWKSSVLPNILEEFLLSISIIAASVKSASFLAINSPKLCELNLAWLTNQQPLRSQAVPSTSEFQLNFTSRSCANLQLRQPRKFKVKYFCPNSIWFVATP